MDVPAPPLRQFQKRLLEDLPIRHHLQVYQPEDVNAASSLSQIRYQKPDLIVVVAYGQILKKPLLELPERGCWNVHA
ncbi:MAG: formyltransferase family protein, partial [Verrucomicrobiota bacterium]